MVSLLPRRLLHCCSGLRHCSSRQTYLSRDCCNGMLRCSSRQTVLGPIHKLFSTSKNRTYHEVTGDIICPSMVQGIDHLRDPRLNKGLAFTLQERQQLGIHGLMPARFKTQEEQLELCKTSVERYQEDLNKYLYLVELQDRNERLFFRLVAENVEQMMPIVYTPTVGLACQKFGLIYRRPRGLFITINDQGHCYDVLKNWYVSLKSFKLSLL